MITKMDFAVVVALDEEASYFTELVECGEPSSLPTTGSYWQITDREWTSLGKGVLISSGKMGQREARNATRAAIDTFEVRLIANIGIAGRVDASRKLGDVVVPSICWDVTDGGKIGANFDSSPSFSHSPRSISVANAVTRIAHTHLKVGSVFVKLINARLLHRFKNRDLLSATGIRVVDQPIICVPNVGAFDLYRDSLLRIDRTIAAMDMESAGFLDVANAGDHEVICIRGISDHAGHDKAAQEQSHKDVNRRLAMESAISAFQMVLTKYYNGSIDVSSTGVFVAIAGGPDLIEDHLDPQKQESIFHLLMRKASGETIENPIDTIARAIEASPSNGIVAVIGDKGSGKTALMRTIQTSLSTRRDSQVRARTSPVLLVRLSELETWTDGQFDHYRTAYRVMVARECIVRKLKETGSIILLVDGLNQTGNIREGIATDVLLGLSAAGSVRIGLSAESINDIERLEIALPDMFLQDQYILEPIDIEDPKLPILVERFREQRLTRSGLAKDSSPAQVIIDQMRLMNAQSVDVYLLQLFFERAADIRDKRMRTLSQLYELLCEKALALEAHSSKAARQAEIARVATVAFGILISGEKKIAEIREQNVARLISTHSSVSYYLVAMHLIATILNSESSNRVSFLSSRLDYVFPSEVNNHTKQMMANNADVEDAVIRVINRRHRSLKGLAKSHLAYLAGRVRRERAPEMLKLLKEMGTQFRGKTRPIDKDDRMLRRTIFISRTLLGDGTAEEQYVDLLLTDVEEAEFNRGFHLVYWGDAKFEASGKMSNRDDGAGPCFRTIARLQDRIARCPRGIPQIELLTLLSLVQARFVRGNLREEHRITAMDLLMSERVANQPLSPKVRGYVERIREDLGNRDFNLSTVLQEWNDLVLTERTGWLRRRRDAVGAERELWATHRIESVAEHTFSTIALAEIFLKSDPQGAEVYDKRRVIDLLRIHDLAEGRLGDLINGQANSKVELTVLWKYGAFATYGGIGDLWSVPERYQEFAECRTLNARIAQDLDRLQFVLQARAIRTGMSTKELAECEQAVAKLTTASVQGIAKLLQSSPANLRYMRPQPKF